MPTSAASALFGVRASAAAAAGPAIDRRSIGHRGSRPAGAAGAVGDRTRPADPEQSAVDRPRSPALSEFLLPISTKLPNYRSVIFRSAGRKFRM